MTPELQKYYEDDSFKLEFSKTLRKLADYLDDYYDPRT
jgi:hypothetical protein